MRLAKEHPNDRIAYTKEKGAFITVITEKAKRMTFDASDLNYGE